MKLTITERIEAASVPITATIRQTMQAIDKGAFGAAIIVDSQTKQFKGIVTDGDIRRALYSGYGIDSAVAKITKLNPVTANAEMSAEQIAGLFSELVRVIPILDRNNYVIDLALLDRRVHLPVAEPLLGDKELQYVSECVSAGWISSAGKFVPRFEQMVADFCRVKYAVSASSGTTALHLALLALGIGPGDEVIVPTLTFIATANAVAYTGAKPVFIDSEPDTWNIDPRQIKAAITPKTKAIIPVHLYGHPADMDPILEIGGKYKLTVIEDAAEAQGAEYKNKIVGSIGNAGILSFYGNKIITTGEGGMVVTNSADTAEKVRILRDHGMCRDRRYWHTVLGYNYRMTNMQAAIGVAQMEKVEHILKARKIISQMYNEGLRSIPGIYLPPAAKWASNVCWLYTILVDKNKFGISRDELAEKLHKEGIETRPVFPPVHTQPIYNTGQNLPVSQYLSQTGMSLPSAVGMQEKDIRRIVQIIAASYKAL